MTRKLPPVWLLGLVNLPFSITSTVMLLTVPQLLAANHVPEPAIASLTAFALVPGFAAFLLAPILDVRFSRRTYALGTACAAALFVFAALHHLTDLGALRWLLFGASLTSNLYQGAVGGWLGSIVPREANARLAAWITVANISGFGIAGVVNITLFRLLPVPWGAVAIAALVLAPLLLMLPLPAPGPDRRLARDSFGQLFTDIRRMVRRPSVLRTLGIFLLPAACFALTNTLGGLGRDFGASERFVGVISGLGVTAAGVCGGLIVPALARRVGAFRLYLAIGTLGALFTLALILLPATPVTFAVAMIGENVAQAAAFTAIFAIIFDEVGKGNALASTEFTVLISASLFPLSAMQWLDGKGYALGGLQGTYLMDGGLGLVGCAGIWLLLRRPVRTGTPAA